jgi:hypothetical protein
MVSIFIYINIRGVVSCRTQPVYKITGRSWMRCLILASKSCLNKGKTCHYSWDPLRRDEGATVTLHSNTKIVANHLVFCRDLCLCLIKPLQIFVTRE